MIDTALFVLGTTTPEVEASLLLRHLAFTPPAWRTVPHDQMSRVQLPERFDLAVFGPGFFDLLPPHEHRLAVHNVVTHLQPSARVIALAPGRLTDYLVHAEACGLKLIDDRMGDRMGDRTDDEQQTTTIMHRRTARTTIHDLVAEARRGLARLTPGDLANRLATDRAIVLDTRTPTDRERFGVIPGSLHTPRTTLEWMCDPASGYSHERIVGLEQCLVTVCNEGYSSSLSAASLQQLGFRNATDLIGGVMAWKALGLPMEQPDHTRFN